VSFSQIRLPAGLGREPQERVPLLSGDERGGAVREVLDGDSVRQLAGLVELERAMGVVRHAVALQVQRSVECRLCCGDPGQNVVGVLLPQLRVGCSGICGVERIAEVLLRLPGVGSGRGSDRVREVIHRRPLRIDRIAHLLRGSDLRARGRPARASSTTSTRSSVASCGC